MRSGFGMAHLDTETFAFIRDLGRNNNREWFEDNRDRYEAARADFLSFIGVWLMEMEAFEPSVAGMDPRRCMFRIYRDTRFSNNKTPFKNNFGARILPGGSKALHIRTGYFLNVQPGLCRISGGAFRPEPEWLNAIRDRLSWDSSKLRAILDEPKFKRMFGDLQGEAVKTAPRGYSKDHPDIDLIRQKSFLARFPLEDDRMFQPGFLKDLVTVCRTIKPLKDYLDETH